MKAFENSIETSYWWKRTDGKDIAKSATDFLKEDADERIAQMTKEGYTSGELSTRINDIEYRGWWETKSKA
jgi:hypothetical protein